MAKKTKEEAQPEAQPKKENLIPCTVARSFVDGNIDFGKYGYALEWPRGEKRYLPMRLIQRVANSGGEIELLRG